MAEPIMQSPLHGFNLASQEQAVDDSRGVWANEIPLLGYISLRGDAGSPGFAEKVAAATGAPLPIEPCSLTAANGVKVLWLSPDEWMIVSRRDSLVDTKNALNAALKGMRSQVADNSGGYTQVFLQGSHALDVLRHASIYDFGALRPGRVVGTTFGKSSVYAHREGEGFCLLLRRSFADYIWRYLVRAASPYGLGIAAVEAPSHAEHRVAS